MLPIMPVKWPMSTKLGLFFHLLTPHNLGSIFQITAHLEVPVVSCQVFLHYSRERYLLFAESIMETSCEHAESFSAGSSPDPNQLEIVASCSPPQAADCSSGFAAPSSSSHTSEMGCPPTSSNTNNNNQEEPSSATPQIFRPIKFESTPASTEGNESESGSSDSALDSAYCSDNAQPFRNPAGAQPYSKKITASLQNKNLWKSFKRIGNEMIVTKPGR